MTLVHPLEYPMEFDGVEYHSVTIRRVKGKDFEAFHSLLAKGHALNDVMIHIMTEIPLEFAEDLFLDDKMDILEAAKPFMFRQLRTLVDSFQPADDQAETTTG